MASALELVCDPDVRQTCDYDFKQTAWIRLFTPGHHYCPLQNHMNHSASEVSKIFVFFKKWEIKRGGRATLSWWDGPKPKSTMQASKTCIPLHFMPLGRFVRAESQNAGYSHLSVFSAGAKTTNFREFEKIRFQKRAAKILTFPRHVLCYFDHF